MLEKLKDKRILILGFGREGQDTLRFLRKIFPKKVIGIADRQESLKLKVQSVKSQLKAQNFENIKWHMGTDYLNALRDYDIIIKSPGIPFKILPKSQLPKITTQTEIFFDNCPGKIVGITGTKGKSTTVSLIYEILKSGLKVHPVKSRRAGISPRAKLFNRVHLVGNIGKPVLNLLFSAKPDNIYVYELSSFQLTNLKKSPHIAVFLNIYPEHLDYYRSFKEYANAKANITRYQTKDDYLVFNSKDELVKGFAGKSRAKKIPIPANYPGSRTFGSLRGRRIFTNIRIPPVINLQNAMAAAAVGRIFGIPDRKIIQAIEGFRPLPHRLEYVGKFRGIKFYNDALATIPEATMAALDILGNNVETIFLGGFDRGLSFDGLAKRLIESKIKTLILFPSTGARIKQAIENFKFPITEFADRQTKGKKRFISLPSNFQYFSVASMKEAVKLAYRHTRKGKICLLSTASASFSIFKNYKEKGDLFKKYVKRYAP